MSVRSLITAVLVALPLAGEILPTMKPQEQPLSALVFVELSIALLRVKAERGDARAQYELGLRFTKGLGVQLKGKTEDVVKQLVKHLENDNIINR